MNNAAIELDEQHDEPQISKEYLEQELSTASRILEAVRSLKDNQNWLTYWALVVEPACKATERKLREQGKDHHDFNAGMLAAFEKGYDLPGLEKKYSQLVQALTLRINSLT